MFRKVEANYDKFNMNKKMLRKVQKFCEKIYSTVMHGNLFQEFLESLRTELRMDLGEKLFQNKTYQEKYLEYI